MHGRQVDDVEAHRRDGVQPASGSAQRPGARHPAAAAAVPRPLGSREELVPGTVERPLPVHDDRAPRRPGEQVAQRAGGEDRGDLRADRDREPVLRRGARVAQPRGHRRQRCPCLDRGRPAQLGQRCRRVALAGWPDVPRGPLEQQRALREHELRVLADRHLDARIVPPAGDRVGPGLHPEMPQPRAGNGDLGAAAVSARGELAHRG